MEWPIIALLIWVGGMLVIAFLDGLLDLFDPCGDSAVGTAIFWPIAAIVLTIAAPFVILNKAGKWLAKRRRTD